MARMHSFWVGIGAFLLIVGGGVLTLVGGMLGIPTILTYTSLAGTPNYLQSLQIVLIVLGAVSFTAGFA